MDIPGNRELIAVDEWVSELTQLNGRLKDSFSDQRLGDKPTRRKLLANAVGPIRPLRKLTGRELEGALNGRPLVGVDGTVNSLGAQFPHYVDLMRALAKPSQGAPIVHKALHCPIPMDEEDEDAAQRRDQDARQRKLADLEVQVALAAAQQYQPAVMLMDGPLVRFEMRTRESFNHLCSYATNHNILLVGCIENIESRVIQSVLGDGMPPGWRHRYDRDLLWNTLDYGEVLAVKQPAKGTYRAPGEEQDAPLRPLRTWFMRSANDPGVVGVEVLEAQADQLEWVADYLFTLSPADGRGIPIWLDIVDREVRLTHVELEAYMGLLEAPLQRIFTSKRDARFF